MKNICIYQDCGKEICCFYCEKKEKCKRKCDFEKGPEKRKCSAYVEVERISYE